MRFVCVLFVAMVGCSSDIDIDVGNYPVDAGADVVLTEDASVDAGVGANCIPILWYYGEDRFCEQCVCPGTPCQTHALNEPLAEGTCDESLRCSAECRDPLWNETYDAGTP